MASDSSRRLAADALDTRLVTDDEFSLSSLRRKLEVGDQKKCAPVVLDCLMEELPPRFRPTLLRTVQASASDPYGDGDQSPVPDPTLPEVAALFSSQDKDKEKALQFQAVATFPLRIARMADLTYGILHAKKGRESFFHIACYMGRIEVVRRCLLEAHQRVHEGERMALTQLLESRMCLMRFTPLHYCVLGARMLHASIVPDSLRAVSLHHKAIIQALCRAGARVDSRDLCGYTPLAHAVSFKATEASIKLVPLLKSHGADLDAKTRFGEPISTDAITFGNTAAVDAMMIAGADFNLTDNLGVSLTKMVACSLPLGKAFVEMHRQKMLSEETCDACGKSGVSKFCSKCRKVYYCSRSCQVKAWKRGHKRICGKEGPPEDYVDIDVDTMTLHVDEPWKGKSVELERMLGDHSKSQLVPKKFGVWFRAALYHVVDDPRYPLLVVASLSGDFLRLTGRGSGRPVYSTIVDFLTQKGDTATAFVLAKWIQPPDCHDSRASKPSHVLRLDISKAVPPPKNVLPRGFLELS